MKIRLVRALGVVLTAGMLMGTVGAATVEADTLQSQDVADAKPAGEETESAGSEEMEGNMPNDVPAVGTETPSGDTGNDVDNMESMPGVNVSEGDTTSGVDVSGNDSAVSTEAPGDVPAVGTDTPGGAPVVGTDIPSGVPVVGADKPVGITGAETDTSNSTPEAAGAGESGSGVALNGWVTDRDKKYWFEDGIKQSDKEIYDTDAEAWYWLDSDGAMVVDTDVYLENGSRWVYYGEDGQRVHGEVSRDGKVYYYEPSTGAMIKGPWVLPDGRKVLYDMVTGQMVRGESEVNGKKYLFDDKDGTMKEGEEEDRFWLTIDNNTYLYVNWERQGWKPADPDYRGEEIYDAETDEWYWLDSMNQGRMAVNVDIYQESQADDEGNIGKWVRYDENGHMVRGWSEDGMYYFDPMYGTRAHGIVVIDGVEYEFDPETGIRIVKLGFEDYGIVCNAEVETEYDYMTCTFANNDIPTMGKAVFHYNTFESDDTHAAREGYEWRQVIVSISFSDAYAQLSGCKSSLLFGLDYYTFKNSLISKSISDSTLSEQRTILYNDVEYEIETNYESKGEWNEEEGVIYTTFCYECQVPAGYDGMVVALYNAANKEKGEREMNRLDENSLIFRLK